MKKVINIIFIFIIELCCAFCLYKNLHHKHKVLEIYDEEALKKENITIDNSTKEFDDKIQKIDNLKNSIQNEIIEIDKTYENVDNQVTKSYKIKIEKLIKEEENLKEKLKTEVTKIKEKLENYLSQINNLSKTFEKIKKGIKLMGNDEEKNMIKSLSYISKINKSQKEMDILTQQLMKNIKITYIEEESIIKYEEYYFNGIPIPKNIEIKNIWTNSFKVFWKLEDINILNVDKNEIKYNIEIRKENENYKKIYEDNNDNYLVNNLEKNTNYEIRICTIYKGGRSNWSEIKKIKTKNIDSLILNEEEKGDEYLEKLYEWSGYKNMELLYRGTRDGSGDNIFHNKCDNQGPTICLCKNEKGNIFGGYSSISWTTPSSSGIYKSTDGCFLFTLTNIYGTEPTKFPNANQNHAVYHYSTYGPTFGSAFNLYIHGNCLNCNGSYARIGGSYNDYQDVLGKGNSVFTGDVNTEYFKLKELEVFKVYN